MSLKIERPKNFGLRDIFMFWLKNKIREKPYLLIKHKTSKSIEEHLCTQVWYTIKHELTYLRKRLLDIDAEIIILEIKDNNKYQFTKTSMKIFELKKDLYYCKDKIKTLSKLPPNSKKLLMSYKTFHDISHVFNKKVVKAIIEGEKFNLGNRLGHLLIKKISRYTSSIDWGASNKNKKELIEQGVTVRTKEYPDGKNWFVYRQTPFYLRWSWNKVFRIKNIPMIRNQKVYAFYATPNPADRTKLGAKGKLAKANHENQFLHMRYENVKLN